MPGIRSMANTNFFNILLPKSSNSIIPRHSMLLALCTNLLCIKLCHTFIQRVKRLTLQAILKLLGCLWFFIHDNRVLFCQLLYCLRKRNCISLHHIRDNITSFRTSSKTMPTLPCGIYMETWSFLMVKRTATYKVAPVLFKRDIPPDDVHNVCSCEHSINYLLFNHDVTDFMMAFLMFFAAVFLNILLKW